MSMSSDKVYERVNELLSRDAKVKNSTVIHVKEDNKICRVITLNNIVNKSFFRDIRNNIVDKSYFQDIRNNIIEEFEGFVKDLTFITDDKSITYKLDFDWGFVETKLLASIERCKIYLQVSENIMKDSIIVDETDVKKQIINFFIKHCSIIPNTQTYKGYDYINIPYFDDNEDMFFSTIILAINLAIKRCYPQSKCYVELNEDDDDYSTIRVFEE